MATAYYDVGAGYLTSQPPLDFVPSLGLKILQNSNSISIVWIPWLHYGTLQRMLTAYT